MMRNAEVITEVLYYADAETNTKSKKRDAEVRCLYNDYADTSGETHKLGLPRRPRG